LPRREAIPGEDSPETQRNLESGENRRRSETNYPRRDEERAMMTERRNSEQSLDNINANRVHVGPGGKWAHDDLDALMSRVGIGTSLSGMDRRSMGPANMALDSVEQNLAFLKKMDEWK
jgi:hypothetical protein